MRVSKIVREYIEEQVGKIYSTKMPEEIAFDNMDKEISDFRINLNDSIEKEVAKEIEKFRIEHNIPADITLRPAIHFCTEYSAYTSEIRSKSASAKDKRNKAKHDAIKEIILNLELGGTKADLDRMLNELATNKNI